MGGDATPDFDAEQCAALGRLVEALRRGNQLVTDAHGDAATLNDVAARIEAAVASLETLPRGKALPRYRTTEFQTTGVERALPYSPVMGRYNALSAPITLTREGDALVGRGRFESRFEGPPGGVHGGVIAGVWDQLLACAGWILNVGGPTAFLRVDYQKPTPLDTDLEFRAWTERIETRKVFVRGECRAGDLVVSTAEALFVLPAPKASASNG